MQFFALAAKCGGFGASGLAGAASSASSPSSRSSEARASEADAAGGGGQEVAAGAEQAFVEGVHRFIFSGGPQMYPTITGGPVAPAPTRGNARIMSR